MSYRLSKNINLETQSPADFVIDGDGKIIRENRGLFDADTLHEFLRSL